MDGEDLIPGHLIHLGYEETLQAFERSEDSVKEGTRSVLDSANEENWLNVIQLLQTRLPNVLEVDTGLLFDLLCLEYVKLVRSKDRMRALEFAHENLASFRELKTHEEMIEDCMILLGYEDLDQLSPPPFLLTDAYQDQVIDKLKTTLTLASLDPSARLKISDEEIQEVHTRRAILECVSNDQVREAVRLTEEAFPGLLEDDMNLRFHLSTLEFFQLVREKKTPEAVEFIEKHFHPIKDPKLKEHTEACVLSIFSGGTHYLLTEAYRQHIAYKLNRRMRAHRNHPPRSKLQSLIKDVLEVQEQLGKQRGMDVVVSPSSLKDVLKDKDSTI
ncbi:putative CTLH/CRA to LisH motif domain-containing protein [Helianthus debilis subsp. tardiflorus]